MPTYVYRCELCGLTFERRQRMTDASLTDCPECEGRVHRVIQPVPIIFKGPGFYVTDNKRSGPTATAPDNGGELHTKSAEEKGAEGKSAEVDTSETKSAEAETSKAKASEVKASEGKTSSSE
jgi:putative FmdB family regulatory protein